MRNVPRQYRIASIPAGNSDSMVVDFADGSKVLGLHVGGGLDAKSHTRTFAILPHATRGTVVSGSARGNEAKFGAAPTMSIDTISKALEFVQAATLPHGDTSWSRKEYDRSIPRRAQLISYLSISTA
jgi:hypothetical protein